MRYDGSFFSGVSPDLTAKLGVRLTEVGVCTPDVKKNKDDAGVID